VQLIESHLNGCPSCRALAQDLHAVEIRLEGLRGIEPRPDFTLGVMAAVAALPVPKPARLRVGWLLAYVAAAWALLIALTAARVIDWQHGFAAVATELGKAGAAGSTFSASVADQRPGTHCLSLQVSKCAESGNSALPAGASRRRSISSRKVASPS